MGKWMKIKLAAGVVLALGLMVGCGFFLKEKYEPSETMGSLDGYYDVAADEAVIIVENERYEENAVLKDGGIYLSYDMIEQVLTDEFYLDAEEQVVRYALPKELIHLKEGEAGYDRDGNMQELENPALIRISGRYYLSLEFVSLFADMNYDFYENPNRLVIRNRYTDFLYYDTTEEAPVRFAPDIKSDIIRYVPAGEKLYYIHGTGSSSKSFIKVMLADGIYGYVQNKFLSDSYYDARQRTWEEPVYEPLHLEEKVRMGWHVVTVPEANKNLEKVVAKATSMNVVSPTWYELSDSEGNFVSLADASYVERAHEMGLQVWALLSNFPMGEDKGYEVNTYELLSSTKARDTLIDHMIAEAVQYGFDGWNIDFESLQTKTGPHYIQFLKELSIRCKKAGLILSVDNYVPAPYNAFYDLETQGKVADYVIIMAYDEHYAGSATAGSVASLGFLRNAVTNSLQMIPKESIVMGIPFYTRLWAEETVAGSTKVSSEALTMNGGEEVLKRNDLKAKWDADCGQNYAEYTLAGVTYKIWLEDVDSVTERLKVIGGAELAGVAAWRLGYETGEIWTIIGDYIK